MLLLLILIVELLTLPATGPLGLALLFVTLAFGEGLSNGTVGGK